MAHAVSRRGMKTPSFSVPSPCQRTAIRWAAFSLERPRLPPEGCRSIALFARAPLRPRTARNVASFLWRFEEFDRIAGRVVEKDLLATEASDDVVAETRASLA